jgi:hypothetical protein
MVVGVILAATEPSDMRFGVLLVGFAAVVGVIEVGIITSARGRAQRAVDDLIDAGTVVHPDSGVGRLVEARRRKLGEESSGRRMATTLRDALADAARPRSSNPLVLAGRSIVLGRGTARALLAERDLVLRIARDLDQGPSNPRAIVALHQLVYPQPTSAGSDADEQQEAQRRLHRVAQLLELADEHP